MFAKSHLSKNQFAQKLVGLLRFLANYIRCLWILPISIQWFGFRATLDEPKMYKTWTCSDDNLFSQIFFFSIKFAQSYKLHCDNTHTQWNKFTAKHHKWIELHKINKIKIENIFTMRNSCSIWFIVFNERKTKKKEKENYFARTTYTTHMCGAIISR